MIEFHLGEVLLPMSVRAVNTVFTLYMLLILFRWAAPWLQIDVNTPRLRWISKLTDPLINAIRRLLPPMGPMDFGPLVALLAVWIVRELVIRMILGVATRV